MYVLSSQKDAKRKNTKRSKSEEVSLVFKLIPTLSIDIKSCDIKTLIIIFSVRQRCGNSSPATYKGIKRTYAELCELGELDFYFNSVSLENPNTTFSNQFYSR